MYYYGLPSAGPLPQVAGRARAQGAVPFTALSEDFGYAPHQVRAAYDIPSDRGYGAIAIVDAYDNPNALEDFNKFSQQYGLPTETSSDVLSSSNQHFQVVYAQGSRPAADAGWAGEISLDIEWAHAMAPNAKIYLVEAADSFDVNLFPAVLVAASLPGVRQVSMSWGGGEYSGETVLDSYFGDGVVYYASTGDLAAERSYPALSPKVVAVGGTTLSMAGAVFSFETAWSDGGAGPSAYEGRPSFQNGVAAIVGSKRAAADVSAVGNTSAYYGGVWVRSKTGFAGIPIAAANDYWFPIYGTSLSCPVFAAISNARDEVYISSATANAWYYSTLYANNYNRDITVGSSGNLTTLTGYDMPTGVGVPAGLYVTKYYELDGPTSATVVTGTLVGGDATSLAATDGSTYDVASTAIARLGQGVAFSCDYTLTGALIYYVQMTPTVVVTGPPHGTLQLFAYNWSTGVYDLLRAFPTTGNLDTFNAILPISYESETNNVRLLYRLFVPSRFGASPFTAQFDQATDYGEYDIPN